MEQVAHLNLDRMAAHHAQAAISATSDKKASDVDNAITKALGVLQESGVYAAFLFLLSRGGEDKHVAREVASQMLQLLGELSTALGFNWGQLPASNHSDQILTFVSDNVSADLERLLLAHELLEQMLIYARYGAKARGA